MTDPVCFLGYTLERGDLATWLSAIATFVATAVALLLAVREMCVRFWERRKAKQVFRWVFESELVQIREAAAALDIVIDYFDKAAVNSSVGSGLDVLLLRARERLELPVISEYMGQLVHFPMKYGSAIGQIAGLAARLRYHVRLFMDTSLVGSIHDIDKQAAQDIALLVKMLRGALMAIDI